MATDVSLRQFHEELDGIAAEFRRVIEAGVSGFPPDAAASRKRRELVQDDFRFFSDTYFPHYVEYDASVLHEFLFGHLPDLVDDSRGRHSAIAAPRGEAKSTIVTLQFVIWCVLTKRKHFIPIIMDAYETQAAPMLEAIKAELEANPRLLMDFPDGTGRGRVWREGVIVTRNNRKLVALGSGRKMRGLRHGPHRPDLVIIDDMENDENVASKSQRDKLYKWLLRTVLRLGPADGRMDVLVIGTILHYDSVLNRLLGNPLWETHKFQALMQWPDRMDLWERFEEILLNASGDKLAREAKARGFYQKRKKEMDKGAQVSWPSGRPLLELMMIRARDGHEAFDAELQNDPISLQDATFGTLIYWTEALDRWIYFGACDPSLGKAGQTRDPSAILVGGYDRLEGRLHVVEAAIRKRVPDLIIEDIIRLQRVYNCVAWAGEANQFQEFLLTELIKRSAQRGVPVPVVPVTQNTDKTLRIESLQPHVANGLIQFHTSLTTLITQLRHWPKADHDDGPDALEMLWKIANSRSAKPSDFRTRRDPARTSFAGYY